MTRFIVLPLVEGPFLRTRVDRVIGYGEPVKEGKWIIGRTAEEMEACRSLVEIVNPDLSIDIEACKCAPYQIDNAFICMAMGSENTNTFVFVES